MFKQHKRAFNYTLHSFTDFFEFQGLSLHKIGSVNDRVVSLIQQEVEIIQRRGVLVFKSIQKSFLDQSKLVCLIF